MSFKVHFAKNIFFKTCFILICPLMSLAQITISFPTSRAVFQRNNENFAFINIIGNYTQSLDKIEARLTPIEEGQGVATDWILIQENLKAGYFAGKIKGQGGWYKMEIRGVQNNVVVETTTVDKVGVGEVFIAVGQSNAQGIADSGANGATDDRVNTVNFFNYDGTVPENLNFVQLSQNVDIAPHGTGPWCYGELGDKLVKRLNVPVVFFNAAFLTVSVINWRESAERQPTFNFVLDIGGRFEYMFNLPYSNLRNTLNYYGALLGVRSLLWIQGETDNSPNRLSADVYAANLQTVVDISRKDFDNNLSWMVARTSLTYQTPSNPEIIGGQNKVIAKAGNNVFAGPFTDNLQIPRADNVHFKNISPDNMGLSLLAENWDKFLDDNFFQNSKPVLAKSIVEPEISCDTDNLSVLKIPTTFSNIEWSNGSKNNQITVEKGIYSVALKDSQGNKYLSPSVNTNLIYPQIKPTITSDKSLEFCTDGTNKIELSANATGVKSYVWSTGETTQKISVGSSSEFSVSGKNDFGCVSELSEKVLVKANPVPLQPKITVAPASSVCEGQNITLSADSNEKLLWSNNATTQSIRVDKVGNYEFSVKVTNEFGCVSIDSTKVRVKIIATPTPPKITVLPANNVCEGQKITLSADSKENFLWSNGDTTQSIEIDKVGNYEFSAKAVNDIGCISTSSLVQKVSIVSLPKQPSIAQVGLFSLQAQNGDFLVKDQFEWKKENIILTTSDNPSLKVTQSGNYKVSTIRKYQISDNQALTCYSKESEPVFFQASTNAITLYPNPASELIYLETKEVIKNLEVRFYTPLGKQVCKFHLDDTVERKEIDLRTLEKGTYIVRIMGDGFEESVRLIIQSK
jgi:Secretion system C-terminal sorting domain/Carbohydrate esterase, sialic acid-specific acetylesterase